MLDLGNLLDIGLVMTADPHRNDLEFDVVSILSIPPALYAIILRHLPGMGFVTYAALPHDGCSLNLLRGLSAMSVAAVFDLTDLNNIRLAIAAV